MAIKFHPPIIVHPGAWLRAEVVVPRGMTVSNVARKLNVSRVTMSNLLNGKGQLSADLALRFEKGFGVSADTLLWMQVSYSLAKIRASSEEPEKDFMD